MDIRQNSSVALPVVIKPEVYKESSGMEIRAQVQRCVNQTELINESNL